MGNKSKNKSHLVEVLIFIASAVLMIIFQNCGVQNKSEPIVLKSISNDSQKYSVSPSFKEINTYILQPRCLMCHQSGTLNYSSYESTMSSGSIVASNPINSSLYQQVLTGAMPQNGDKLSDEDLTALKNWIEAGAKNEVTGIPPAAPSTPLNFTANSLNQTQIILNWVLGSDNTANFILTRASNPNGPFSTVATLSATVNSFTDTGLNPLTSYYYQISALNTYGSSAPTTTITTKTLGFPPSAPTLLAAGAIGQNQALLSWVDNATDETGYKLEIASNSAGPYTLLTTLSANSSSYLSTGLNTATSYFFRVQAFNDLAGASEYSNILNITTAAIPLTAPTAPTGLQVLTASSVQLDLSWADISSTETGFKIERSLSATGTYNLIFTTSANTNSYSDVGLTPNTTYYYRIKSFNSIGDSAYTTVKFATTSAVVTSAPSAPTALNLTVQSASQINLTWVDNSNNENGFKIERSSSSSGPFSEIATVNANITSFSNTGLNAATSYSYRIIAYNSVGSSSASNTSTAITSTLPPVAPTNLIATASSSSVILLSWLDNSSNETNFKIERSNSSSGPFTVLATVAADVTSYSDSALTPVSTYYYRVSSSNAGGVSGYSNISTNTSFGTFTWINNNIIKTSCTSCHSGTKSSGSYDMSTYTSTMSRVFAGNATSSLLYNRVLDGSMPKAGPLSTVQINAIKTWINSGALNN